MGKWMDLLFLLLGWGMAFLILLLVGENAANAALFSGSGFLMVAGLLTPEE